MMLQMSNLEEFNPLLLGNLRHHGFIQITGVSFTAMYFFTHSDFPTNVTAHCEPLAIKNSVDCYKTSSVLVSREKKKATRWSLFCASSQNGFFASQTN